MYVAGGPAYVLVAPCVITDLSVYDWVGPIDRPNWKTRVRAKRR